MHQPWYVDPGSQELLLPWVRLHAASSYSDMAALLEDHPAIRATVCFSPALLWQVQRYLEGADDTHIGVTMQPADELSLEQREFLVRHFFSAHWGRVLTPNPRYRHLLDKRGEDAPEGGWGEVAARFSCDELRDLQLLFNLVWCGFSAADSPRIAALIEQGEGFAEQDKGVVLEHHRHQLQGLLPAWRRLHQRGSVELIATPSYHPVMPLLIDSATARRPTPRVMLPERFVAPKDADAQLAAGLECARQFFEARPLGLWPPEAAISPETVRAAQQQGFRYVLADAGILFHSLDERGSAPGRQRLYQPYRFENGAVLFRDAELSGRVMREYHAWDDQEAAAADLLQRVRRAGQEARVDGGAAPLVVIGLPAEQPWEAYPERGRPFLEALYRGIERADDIRSVTVEQHLAEHPPTTGLDYLHSGSWIEGNFAMWIGDPEKNTAWSRLRRARTRLTRAETTGEQPAEQLAEAREHLLRAEGSDWFYWLGEPFYSAEDAIYEALFRAHLLAMYRALGDAPPADLSRPIDQGSVVVPLRQPTGFIQPGLTGSRTSFFEWREAGFYRASSPGSPRRDRSFIAGIYWGFDPGRIYLRLDPVASPRGGPSSLATGQEILIELTEPGRCLSAQLRLNEGTPELSLTASTGGERTELGQFKELAIKEVIEMAIPISRLGLGPGARLGLTVHFLQDGEELARVPLQGVIEVEVPAAGYEVGPSYKV